MRFAHLSLVSNHTGQQLVKEIISAGLTTCLQALSTNISYIFHWYSTYFPQISIVNLFDSYCINTRVTVLLYFSEGEQSEMTVRKPHNYRSLLTTENAKTSKGEDLGYFTGILYLAPADEAGRGNICTYASDGCKGGCLFKAGRAQFTPSIITARLSKTHFLFDNRKAFINSLRYDIAAVVRSAKRQNLIPAIRINGTSDLSSIALQMAAEFPDVQFYDYTKLPKAWQRTRANYHLTFSHSENNSDECERALAHGLNVAVVFDVKRGAELPTAYYGVEVIDGDKHDLRFLDGYQGKVIGLRAKGPAKKDCSGFVVKTQTLIQIINAA